MNNDTSPRSLFDIAAGFVLHTSRHVFLTGRAGTGKTTFLKHIREKTGKKTAIVAPTGVAAINAGGVTIHSLFQFPLGYFIPEQRRGFSMSASTGMDVSSFLANARINREKRKLLEELELLVIDEVSMLRADLLDAMDGVLRHFRKKPSVPFGGVQLLLIGDLYQLPPVVKDEEWASLSRYYKSMFFFDALVMQEAAPVCIELDKIYRQSDEGFISLLNSIRNNTVDDEELELLNKHYDPYFYPEAEDGFIMLTSHNYKADKINQSALARLQGDVYEYEGELRGDFNENALPAERKLVLKGGAQIMFIRNDKGDQRRYYNGKIGIISRISEEEIYVRFPGERQELQLEKEVWRNIRYNYNDASDRVEEEELGAYTQYPVRLAWAVTIHKSQGLTFEKAIIDAGQSFAPGQVYVALSRLVSMKGLVLSTPITKEAIQTEHRIAAFSQRALPAESLLQELHVAQMEYLFLRLQRIFDLTRLLQLFREHHEEYKGAKLPHQEDAMNWSAGALKTLGELSDVGERFQVQLRQLIANNTGGYDTLHSRVVAGKDYFLRILEGDLLGKLKAHLDVTSVKTKVKKYQRKLQFLNTALLRKKQELIQAALITEGVASGISAYELLDKLTAAPPVASADISGTEKEESRAVSLRLFRDGMSLEEIAAERGLVEGTVESHLVSYLATGEVKLRDLVSEEDEKKITDAVHASKEKTVTAIRIALKNEFSYGIIRAVLWKLQEGPAASR